MWARRQPSTSHPVPHAHHDENVVRLQLCSQQRGGGAPEEDFLKNHKKNVYGLPGLPGSFVKLLLDCNVGRSPKCQPSCSVLRKTRRGEGRRLEEGRREKEKKTERKSVAYRRLYHIPCIGRAAPCLWWSYPSYN